MEGLQILLHTMESNRLISSTVTVLYDSWRSMMSLTLAAASVKTSRAWDSWWKSSAATKKKQNKSHSFDCKTVKLLHWYNTSYLFTHSTERPWRNLKASDHRFLHCLMNVSSPVHLLKLNSSVSAHICISNNFKY